MLDILNRLGVDYTLFFQIAVWIIAYLITKSILLDKLVFRIKQRQEATFGSDKETDKFLAQALEKEKEYSVQAKDLDTKIKEIFSQKLDQTQKEVLKKISVAKKEAQKSLELEISNVEQAKTQAQLKLLKQVPEISLLIKEKIFN